jgi:hypothetical protein
MKRISDEKFGDPHLRHKSPQTLDIFPAPAPIKRLYSLGRNPQFVAYGKADAFFPEIERQNAARNHNLILEAHRGRPTRSSPSLFEESEYPNPGHKRNQEIYITFSALYSSAGF